MNFRNGYLKLGAPQTAQPQILLTSNNSTIDVTPVGSTPVGSIILNSNASASSRIFTLSGNGFPGQTVTILFIGSNGAKLQNSGLNVLTSDWTAGDGDSITVQWSGASWFELARNNVTAQPSDPFVSTVNLTTNNQAITVSNVTAQTILLTTNDTDPTQRVFTLSSGTTEGATLTLLLVTDTGVGSCQLATGSNIWLRAPLWVGQAYGQSLTLEWQNNYWTEVNRSTDIMPSWAGGGSIIIGADDGTWYGGAIGGNATLAANGTLTLANSCVSYDQLRSDVLNSRIQSTNINQEDFLDGGTYTIVTAAPAGYTWVIDQVVIDKSTTVALSGGSSLKFGLGSFIAVEFPNIMTNTAPLCYLSRPSYTSDGSTNYGLDLSATEALPISITFDPMTGGDGGSTLRVSVTYHLEVIPHL